MELSKTRTGIEQKLYELSEKIVHEAGYILYDMDYINGSKTLRVFIMDEKTKSAVIEDCIKVDHGFTPYMEDEQMSWIPDDIVLEVSSPGAYRVIKTLDHLEMSRDQRVSIALRKDLGELIDADIDKKIAKSKRFLAVLKEFDQESITLDLDDEYLLKLRFEDIKKINLEPDI